MAPRNNDRASRLKADQVVNRTGCEWLKAVSLLKNYDNNVEAACNEYLFENTGDFTLPQIPAPPALSHHAIEFNLRDVVGAIQGGETCEKVRAYLTHYNEAMGLEIFKAKINDSVHGCPAIFYVVKTGNADMVKLWVCHGADVNSTYCRVPLLGFAITLRQSFRTDMPLVIRTLLSSGASVDVIPRAFYDPLHRDLPEEGPPDDELADMADQDKAWCSSTIRQQMARALNFSFTIRYVLDLASEDKPLSDAYKELARVHKATGLLGIRYFLIGQTLASGLLIERFLAYLAMPPKQPLVLLFAGPSGHGKTELARNLGRLLGFDLRNVDCTNLKRETDLFGPWFPYQGWEKGSVVNNFLAGHNARQSIVFLDEFEKTEDEVRQALLVPFDSGNYRDRRTLVEVNCSKTIWVLATNAFDQTIQDFCANNKNILFGNEETVKKLGRQLSRKIQRESIGVFGAPLTGRITDFIPFLTFSPIEQAAVGDKWLTEFGRKLVKPVNTCDDPSQYRPVGNVDLQVKRGYSVCKALATQGYIEELGARSIINEVDREVEMPLKRQYFTSREEICENQPAGSFVVGVDAESGEAEVSQFPVEDSE